MRLSRRSALRLGAAVASAAAMHAGPAEAELETTHLDADLLELGEEFERLWAIELDLASNRVDEEVLDAAVTAVYQVAERIVDLPARTLEGLGYKAVVAAWMYGSDPVDIVEAEGVDGGIVRSMASDLLAMTGRDPTLAGPRLTR